MVITVYNGKVIYNFRTDNKNLNFPTQFNLGSMFYKLRCAEIKEVSFKKKCMIFSVHYNAINKSEILNIHKHLTVKNNV